MADELVLRMQNEPVGEHRLTHVPSKGDESSNVLDSSTPQQVKRNSSTSEGSKDISRVYQVSETESSGHVDRSKVNVGTVDDDADRSPDYDVDGCQDREGTINDDVDKNHGYEGTIDDNHDDVHRIEDCEESIDDDVEPDTIPSNQGPGFVNFSYGGHQLDHRGAFAQVPPSRSKTSGYLDVEREPSTIVQQIDEMYRCRRQFDEANHLQMMDMVAILMQEMEMLSLQNKDLKQQVRCLKEENSHLRKSSGGLVKEVGQLQEREMLCLQNKDLEQQVKRLKEENNHLRISPGGLVKKVGQLQETEMLSLPNKDMEQQVKRLKEENSLLRTSPGGLVKEVGHLQDTEMLSLQNKDLKQQVRCLKEEKSHLQTSPGGLVKEVGQLQETDMLSLQNKDLEQQVKRLKEENSLLQKSSEDLVKEVNGLYQNMKQAVDRVCYYQERFKELELPQAEKRHIETEPIGAVDISDKSDANS
ncbi:uncharacterized protein LOC129274824 [Lytechinus pictus]|uniref:uncharacterized protein LOC129274824 n=1 Tax=Lytechinus pictus TaxID=7653 RepID=UPI0030BA01AF